MGGLLSLSACLRFVVYLPNRVLFSLTSAVPLPVYFIPSSSYPILQLPHFQPFNLSILYLSILQPFNHFFCPLTCLLCVGDGQGQRGGVPVSHQPVRRPHVEVGLLRVSENSARQCACMAAALGRSQSPNC
jgi:hypothetical protein